MLTDAPESGATEEAVDEATADLTTEQEVVELDTDIMSDDAFSAFMAEQLGGSDYAEEVQELPTQESVAHEQADELSEEGAELPPTEQEALDENPEVTETQGMTFTVDGQEITVTDEADIKRLVERGLNSAVEAKQALPAQQLAQMLANNKLTDPNQLNHLIDIANGDPAAIRKLIKDKGIDPYDLASPDGEEANAEEYKPNDHTVKPETVALNKVLDSLQDSEHFSTTADVVMEQWDEASRAEFMANPSHFTALNNQVADGTYEAISTEMKKLDILGKLPAGRTQFELYRQVGDMMYAEKRLPGQEAQEVKPAAPAVVEEGPTPEQRLQKAAQEKRKRAVAPSRSIPSTRSTNQVPVSDKVYSVSDEDFIKQTAHLFNTM